MRILNKLFKDRQESPVVRSKDGFEYGQFVRMKTSMYKGLKFNQEVMISAVHSDGSAEVVTYGREYFTVRLIDLKRI